jgi:hypothetical protein
MSTCKSYILQSYIWSEKIFWCIAKKNYSNFIDQLHHMFEMNNEGLWKANMNVKFRMDVQLLKFCLFVVLNYFFPI